MRKLPKEQPLLQLQANDAWHLRNIEQWLEPAIEYARSDHVMATHKAWHDYCEAESRRLQDRAAIMERHGIERYPHVHQEREIEAMRAIRYIIEAKLAEQGKQIA